MKTGKPIAGDPAVAAGMPPASIDEMMNEMGRCARSTMKELSRSSNDQRNEGLRNAARELRNRAGFILAENRKDLVEATDKGVARALIDRLALDSGRVEGMARGLEAVAALEDPLGRRLAQWDRPNGLRIERVSVPLGVIGMIYESRPNVTADAAALCLKSGNAVILRGGSECFASSCAIHRCIADGVDLCGLPQNAVQFVPITDRQAVGYMLSSMREYLDVLIPRGGKSLVQRVQDEATVPVIGHLEGICHVYLHESADVAMARNIVLNAKMRRPGICGAAETLLVDATAAPRLVPEVVAALVQAGCEVRGDEIAGSLSADVIPARDADWTTEYLDAVISIRIVDGVEDAIDHIRRYGSGHTESIVAENAVAAERFLAGVDSAIVMHNASTQFADGGEFGMGAEMGIATGRMHARGPVGAEQLTSYKYLVRGSGQLRP
ncbi:MAG: glutamate-5-semialdehyde dehydrogenase [Woeseia sp.]